MGVCPGAKQFELARARQAESDRPGGAVHLRHRGRGPSACAEASAAFQGDPLDAGRHADAHDNIRGFETNGSDNRLAGLSKRKLGNGAKKNDSPRHKPAMNKSADRLGFHKTTQRFPHNKSKAAGRQPAGASIDARPRTSRLAEEVLPSAA